MAEVVCAPQTPGCSVALDVGVRGAEDGYKG